MRGVTRAGADTYELRSSCVQEELLLVCNEVKAAGESMQRATLEFSRDTLDSERREGMADASRVLLMAVTRLLVVVDTIDTHSPSQTSLMVPASILHTHIQYKHTHTHTLDGGEIEGTV